ncbi:hypothetical protein GCM10009682_36940 [Luedemannella flava]|uniref:Uncharacterized protein n=1 Tax=Luedemannella flava TaxID=349316 RepID=A0ABP4YDA4_9ACTN
MIGLGGDEAGVIAGQQGEHAENERADHERDDKDEDQGTHRCDRGTLASCKLAAQHKNPKLDRPISASGAASSHHTSPLSWRS